MACSGFETESQSPGDLSAPVIIRLRSRKAENDPLSLLASYTYPSVSLRASSCWHVESGGKPSPDPQDPFAYFGCA